MNFRAMLYKGHVLLCYCASLGLSACRYMQTRLRV